MSYLNGTAPVDHRQRLAWMVLLGSFFICLLLTVTIPVGVSAALQNMRQELPTLVQANQGTVRVDTPSGESSAVLPGEDGRTLEVGARILTDETSTASLLVYSPVNGNNPLARLQIYSRSTVEIMEAYAPRFSLSDEAYALNLYLENGRLQFNLLEEEQRPFIVNIHTPHGRTLAQEPGQYALIVDNETSQISVSEGVADVIANDGQTLRLESQQRAEIQANNPPVGPLDTNRNLVRNGDFADGWGDWSLYVWNVELDDQPEGVSEIVTIGGETAVRFARQGIGHADVRLRQLIGQDVADYEALRLLLTFQISGHDLGVCGIQGSECPLFLRVNYTDERGVKRTWQHGFYANGDISPATPDACVSCAVVQDTHQRAPLGQILFYETDFLEELARQGAPAPLFIEDVSLVSSGHSFQVEILEVAILVEE